MLSMRPRYLVTLGVPAAALLAIVVAAFTLGISLRGPAVAPSSGREPTQTLPLAALAASTTATTITVIGSGTAMATPDQATVMVGVSATRPNVHDAVAAAQLDMSHLLAALHGQGVLDKDIQTQTITISVQTNCCPSVLIGYQAADQLTVTVHHLNNVSGVLMAAIDAVGNDVQLNGVNLFVGNPAAAISSARSSAMTDAASRAQEWAKLAGHHVGGLISLSEVVQAVAYAPCGGCGGAGGGFAVQPGQTSFTVTITATYELIT